MFNIFSIHFLGFYLLQFVCVVNFDELPFEQPINLSTNAINNPLLFFFVFRLVYFDARSLTFVWLLFISIIFLCPFSDQISCPCVSCSLIWCECECWHCVMNRFNRLPLIFDGETQQFRNVGHLMDWMSRCVNEEKCVTWMLSRICTVWLTIQVINYYQLVYIWTMNMKPGNFIQFRFCFCFSFQLNCNSFDCKHEMVDKHGFKNREKAKRQPE